MSAHPLQAAMAAACSFATGAALPLLVVGAPSRDEAIARRQFLRRLRTPRLREQAYQRGAEGLQSAMCAAARTVPASATKLRLPR
jgi:hypothetical protein